MPPQLYKYVSGINFDWAYSPPDPRIFRENNFSTRWYGFVKFPPGRYRIIATSDDGVRVFMDGRNIIDNWKDQPLTTETRMIDLVGRWHELLVEYYEHEGISKIKFDVARGLFKDFATIPGPG
jgi:hypothetical protein